MYEQRWPWTSRWPSVCVTLLARTSQHPSLVCRHMVELLGPRISMSQGLFLHQSTQTHKKLIYLRLAGSEFTISVFKRRKTISTTTGPKAPDDGQEDARNMLSCIWTTSNKSERLMHLVGWLIWIKKISTTMVGSRWLYRQSYLRERDLLNEGNHFLLIWQSSYWQDVLYRLNSMRPFE